MDSERDSQQTTELAQRLAAGALETATSEYCYSEVGRYTRAEGGALEPAPIEFQGRQATGRGLYIPTEEIRRFAAQYRGGTLVSHFSFASSDPQEIELAALESSLTVAGDYFFVFNAVTSAEIVHAINQAIDIVERLHDSYDVPYEAVTVYFGGRELEVCVDAAIFGALPHPQLPEIYKRMTRVLLGLDPLGQTTPEGRGQVDFRAYRYDFMSAIAGTQVSGEGRETYKIRLSYNAFKKLSYQRLNEFSQQVQALEAREPWKGFSAPAGELFNEMRTSLGKQLQGNQDTIASLFYGGASGAVESGTTNLKQLAPALLKRLFDESRQVLPSPSPQLDDALAGGLHPGDLYVVAGFPGSGTSTLALQFMNHAVVEGGAHCIFAGLQRGVDEQFKRSLAATGRIPIAQIDHYRMHPREMQENREFSQQLYKAYERYLTSADRIISLEGSAAASPARLSQIARERKETLRAKGDTSKLLLVIDSLQLMLAVLRTNVHSGSLDQELELSAERADLDLQSLTARLKAIARELDIPVLATLEYYDQHVGGFGYESATTADRGGNLNQLFFDTQFADTLMMLSRLGASTEMLSAFYANGGGSANGEAQDWQKKLSALQQEHSQTAAFKRLDSEFAVVDILKNRSGPIDKVLLLLHKQFATFEALDFKS